MRPGQPGDPVAGAVMATLECRQEQNPYLPRLSRCAVHLGQWTADGCGTVATIATAAAPIAAAAELDAMADIAAGHRSQCGGFADQEQFRSHHYPDPQWAYCDGCSAAAAADAGTDAVIGVLRARAAELRGRYVRGCTCLAGDVDGGWHERRGEQCRADEVDVWRRLPSGAEIAAALTEH